MKKSDDTLSTEPKRGRGRPRKSDVATPAQRQQKSRAKRANRIDGELPLSVMIGFEAIAALSRLTAHGGVTRQQLLEKLILAADHKVQDAKRLLGVSKHIDYMERKLTGKQKKGMESPSAEGSD